MKKTLFFIHLNIVTEDVNRSTYKVRSAGGGKGTSTLSVAYF